MNNLMNINHKKMTGKNIKEFMSKLDAPQDIKIAETFKTIYPSINENTVYKIAINQKAYKYYLNLDQKTLDSDNMYYLVRGIIKITKIKNFNHLSIYDPEYFCNLKSFIKTLEAKYNLRDINFIVNECNTSLDRFRTLYINHTEMANPPKWVMEVLQRDYGINLTLSFPNKYIVMGSRDFCVMDQETFEIFNNKGQEKIREYAENGNLTIFKFNKN